MATTSVRKLIPVTVCKVRENFEPMANVGAGVATLGFAILALSTVLLSLAKAAELFDKVKNNNSKERLSKIVIAKSTRKIGVDEDSSSCLAELLSAFRSGARVLSGAHWQWPIQPVTRPQSARATHQ